MAKVITLENGNLSLPDELLAAMGLKGDDQVVVDVQNETLVLRPLSRAEAARQRLLAHLELPAGALAHRVLNPDEPATLETELVGCEDIYADID